MSENIWGASRAEWQALASLCLPDLRPTVLNPDLMTHPTKERPESVRNDGNFSKRPSYLRNGLVSGILGWTKSVTLEAEYQGWATNPNYGCGFVGRTLKAIDIDIDDEDLAEEVDAAIAEFFGEFLPQRRRHNSSRRMLIFRLTEPDRGRAKVVVQPEAGGAIEFLFDRSFFVMAGMHKSGNRQYWPDGIPTSLEEVPAISVDQLHELIRFLHTEFSCVGPLNFDTRSIEEYDREDSQVDRKHPTYKAIVESEFFRAFLPNGQIGVKCPWWDQHTDKVELPEDVTVTTVFPIGLGGVHDHIGFKCQHVTHGPKTGADFLEAIGYVEAGATPEDFPVVENVTERQLTRPEFIRVSKTGTIPANEINLDLALNWLEGLGLEIAFDSFKGDVMVRRDTDINWIPFTDEDYFVISKALIRMGFQSVPETKLRMAVGSVAKARQRDSAMTWIRNLEWDGKDRLSRFHVDVLHAQDTPYAQAVVYYLFTAMAGRLLHPGVKADMIPVLVGKQGARKSTFIHALAPFEDWSVDVDLSSRDADTSRQLRGKAIAELAELRGLGTRDEDSIKAWVTRTHEEWVPKFKEFTNKYPRRFAMVGSVNHRRFLADATGERRWLPLVVCEDTDYIDVNYVLLNLEQLWAQAASLFISNGIMWQNAEMLAKEEHEKFTKRNLLARAIQVWLHEVERTEVTLVEVAERGLRMDIGKSSTGREVFAIERAMMSLGFEEGSDGIWRLPFL